MKLHEAVDIVFDSEDEEYRAVMERIYRRSLMDNLAGV